MKSVNELLKTDILELHRRGFNYRQIVLEIERRFSLQISKNYYDSIVESKES